MKKLVFESFEKNYIAHILKEIYIDKVYEPLLQGRTDLTILDLGANIGLFSLYASKYASKVIAVEPASDIFEYLEKNSKQYENITPARLAIGGENGSLELYRSDENLTMFSFIRTPFHSEKSEKVKKVGVNTLLNLHSIDHVDFMKLDIEGSEFDVLASDEFMKAAPKIDVIMGEIHPWVGRNPQQCVQALEEAGFSVEIICQSPILFLARKK